MELNSTPFISYHDINVEEADLYGDAWGFNTEFSDVIGLLGQIRYGPGEQLIERLIGQIRKKN